MAVAALCGLWLALAPTAAGRPGGSPLSVLRPPAVVELTELRILDWHAQLRGPLRLPRDISIVAIDEASLKRIGHWPWPRTRTAEIVARLAEAGARVIVLDILLNEPDQNSSLDLARSLADRYRTLGLGRIGGPIRELGRSIERALATADTDAVLAEALAATRRVVVPYFFVFESAPAASPLDDAGRRFLNRSRIVAFQNPEAEHALSPTRAAGSVGLPLARFQAELAGSGHANALPDRDGVLRHTPLVVQFGDGLYPSVALETARLHLGLPRTRVQITADRRIMLGAKAVPVDERGWLLLSHYGAAGSFPTISAADVLEGTAPLNVEGQIVLVGFTALGLMDTRPTPFDPVMPGVETHATILGNLLEGPVLRIPGWLLPLEGLALLLVAVLAPLGPPRLGALWSTVVAVAVVGLVLGGAHAAFRAGVWLPVLPPLVAVALGHVGSVTYQVLVEQREQRWIRRAFMQYVPPALVRELGRDPAALVFGGRRRALTVLFSDIRGFTSFSERHPPEQVVETLHEYLTAMVEIIFRHRGTLDKFIGDAIMAFFGAPFDNPDHAIQACRAAVEMSALLEQLNERWRAEGHDTLQAGFGVATGEMLVGNFGSAQRFTYTVIGDQVNLAARLETLNKDYPTRRHVIISEQTYQAVRERVTARSLGSVTVKGKLQPVEIYDLVDVNPSEGHA
ncbi:MAG: hypothetical protein DMD79_08460 [Candidatus Rokuibacteriota bacterium]|nr:MAG: hypothetical protein DMD79_08460 [Candidatus Rokubacteria bacterium]